ncbi:helix-hairpin-helix domain-containing protein [candidate division KSB1 bacterium]|nr:helix-hairpin-helix domain-containing protein [candidate division KSB1 bacterium]
MWRMEFRPATLVWLLAILFLVGATVRVVERWGHAPRLPLAVVPGSSSIMQARIDSVLRARAAARNAPVNINSATAQDLERLRGIGPTLAAAIVEYRDQHGPFGSIDGLTEVSGIGPKRLEQMRAQCVLDSQ